MILVEKEDMPKKATKHNYYLSYCINTLIAFVVNEVQTKSS